MSNGAAQPSKSCPGRSSTAGKPPAKFAEKLRQQPLRRISFTSISNALAFSRRLFQLNPYAGRRRVIDISGDGPNNAGTPAPVARNNTAAQGIVIDGLPIMLNRGSASIPDLDAYFKECVIGGQGAFLLRVSDIDQFSEAIFRKLLTEISGLTLSRLAHPSLHSRRLSPRLQLLPSAKRCMSVGYGNSPRPVAVDLLCHSHPRCDQTWAAPVKNGAGHVAGAGAASSASSSVPNRRSVGARNG